jgi:AMP-activated protein kinase-like protein
MSRLSSSIAATLLAVVPAAATAQTEASLGLGLGTVRFPGGSTLGVLSLGPSLLFQGPSRTIAADATVANLPSGTGYVQGALGGWTAISALTDHWRLAVDARLSGATTGEGAGSGAGRVALEGVYTTPRWGMAVATGPASGWIAGALPVTAWRTRLRGWRQGTPGNPDLFASIEPTRFLHAWFTDVTGGAVLRRAPFEAIMSASGRLSRTYGSKAAGLAAVELRLSPTVTFEASGGNVLPDPYQGLPASAFVTAGVRLHFPLRASAAKVLVRSRPLTAFRRGPEVVIRFRWRDAHVVAIAGDWNDWTPAPLVRTTDDQWEVSLSLSAGPHRFMVLVDGASWQIPDGVPNVPDGMGGRVGVLNVF